MPNWCENHINVEGDPDEVQRLIATVRGGDSDLDFDRIIPMPDILKCTHSGGMRMPDGTIRRVWFEETDAEGTVVQRPPNKAEQAELDATGFDNWYDWAVANWGTKWTACHASCDVEGRHARFCFNTAWGEPRPIFLKLREMFPRLTFKFSWCYEGKRGFHQM